MRQLRRRGHTHHHTHTRALGVSQRALAALRSRFSTLFTRSTSRRAVRRDDVYRDLNAGDSVPPADGGGAPVDESRP